MHAHSHAHTHTHTHTHMLTHTAPFDPKYHKLTFGQVQSFAGEIENHLKRAVQAHA